MTAEEYMSLAEQKYIIPTLLRAKFPDLIQLIYETESMNADEREYWLQIMPIMSEDQLVKFRQILVNEKEELAKLDQDYKQEQARIIGKPSSELTDEEVKKKFEIIKASEAKNEKEEKTEEENLLKQLGNM